MAKRKRPKFGMRSTRQLMGIEAITDHSIVTPMGELVYYILQPTNTSVMPASGLTDRIQKLLNVIRVHPELEMMALNSRDSFTANKSYYRERIAQEKNPAIRHLLEQDCDHLEDIQALSTLAREFYLVLRLKGQKESTIHTFLSGIEQSIVNNGFVVRRAGQEDLKRMLAVYFEQNVTTEQFPDYDGQQYADREGGGRWVSS